MLSPRWIKLLRDMQLAPGRMAMMVLAIAAGVFGVATVLTSYTVLSREVARNYLETNPASASLEMDPIDAALLTRIRQRPGIADAQASATVGARIAVPQQGWLPLVVFVEGDFDAIRINTISRSAGAWPPPPGSILMEREALDLAGVKIGDSVTIRTANGIAHRLTVSGTVHDPALPPARRGQTVYAYATPATMGTIGEKTALTTLRITVRDQPFNLAAIESTASQLALWLRGQGHGVNVIRVPPPGEHPHAKVMTSLLLMLLIFSGMALALSAILTATMIDGILAQQKRQIGVMKTIGARTGQIAGVYIVLIAVLGLAATALGVPAGMAAGRAFAGLVLSEMLNFTMHSGAVPAWEYVALVLAGVLLPVALGMVPVMSASRTTVRAVLDDVGGARDFGASRIDQWLGALRGVDRTLLMALRNAFRRKGRLLLTLALLGTAGAMFISSLNIKKASEQHLLDAAADRHYDLETVLSGRRPERSVLAVIAAVPGVVRVESWPKVAAAKARADGLALERSYPDGAHGTLTMSAAPDASAMIRLPMLAGRWLGKNDDQSVVLNHEALDFFPNAKVGDLMHLTVGQRPLDLRVVGIARQYMSAATAFVTPATLAAATGKPGLSSAYRVVTSAHDAAAIASAAARIEAALEAAGIGTRLSITETMLRKDVDGHFDLLLAAMLFISLLMAAVGIIGLASAMGTNVAERTREFGIMRSIGARPGTVLRNVLSEGVCIGLMSWMIAAMLCLPVSAAIGAYMGNLLFGLAFPLAVSARALAAWLAIITIGSALASAIPAWKATRLTIRESLVYN